MVGRELADHLPTALAPGREELDLLSWESTRSYFEAHQPKTVFLAAARVGGIGANRTYPAEFLTQNLLIQTHTFEAARLTGVQHLVFLGSSCMYPRLCPQPMHEESLMTGPLEPTNEGYAMAKLAGALQCRTYAEQYGMRCLCPVPCNLYGPRNTFDPLHSHVMGALVKRFVDARRTRSASVTLWGTGSARREFLHVADLVRALFVLLDRHDSPDPINVGSGSDVSIAELATIVSRAAGFEGEVLWDHTKPDGMPQKLMDVSRMEALGFSAKIGIEEGVRQLVAAYEALEVAA